MRKKLDRKRSLEKMTVAYRNTFQLGVEYWSYQVQMGQHSWPIQLVAENLQNGVCPISGLKIEVVASKEDLQL
jgi:hypothetical protein